MEKLQPYLAQLKKHHFWVLTLIVLVTGLVGWMMASSALSKQYDTQKQKITGSFGKVSAITSVQNHPNSTFKTGVEGKTTVLKKNVLKAWTEVYSLQTTEVLQWPESLGNEFLSIMKTLKPTDEIPVFLRETYQNYIEDEFPRLLEIVNAESYKDQEAKKAPGRKLEEEPAEAARDYKVVWDSENQRSIADKLEFQQAPNSKQVRETQEDLWVYRALLEIIAGVNEGATGRHNAKIREINDLSIGQDAAQQFLMGIGPGRIAHLAAAGGGPPVAAGAAPPPAPNNANDGRYVDAQGKPLTAESQPPPEFKRMPIHLRLSMDQREVNQLLTECANSPLPVEVRQLRLNNKDGGGGMRRGGGRPAQRRAPAAIGVPGQQNLVDHTDDDANPYDMPVELHGIIYIFNPPDEAKLAEAKAESAEGAPADAAAPVNPAAPPSAPPATP